MGSALQLPEPGIYDGIPYEVYDSWPYMRASKLCHMGISARRLKWAIDGRLPNEETVDRLKGKAIHAITLEGWDAFRERFKISSPCCAVTKAGKVCGNTGTLHLDGKWYCGVKGHAPEGAIAETDVISQDQLASLELLSKELETHDLTDILRKPGRYELSCVFDLHGVRMKCRLDKLNDADDREPLTVVDLKKVQSGKCGVSSCQKSAEKWLYYVQAATYRTAMRILTGETKIAVAYFFVEDAPPYDVACLQATRAEMDRGDALLEMWLKNYRYSLEHDYWPGGCPEVELGLLPDRERY